MRFMGEMENFVAVGRALSFKDAAKSLGIPVSTLSRQIAAFEHELGFQLFARTTRRVELTPIGREYLTRCAAIVDAAHEAQEEVLGRANEPQGLLRVSMEADVGATLIAPAIAAMHEKYPKIRLDLDLSPRRVDLIAEGFDLAIRIGALRDSSLVARRIATLSVGLYASSDYLKRNGKPSTPADLERHARLHLLHQHDDGAWNLHSGRRRATVSARGAVACANSMAMLLSLLRRGMGIAIADELLAAPDLREGRLKRVLPTWTLPPVAVSILSPSRLLPSAARMFITEVGLALSAS